MESTRAAFEPKKAPPGTADSSLGQPWGVRGVEVSAKRDALARCFSVLAKRTRKWKETLKVICRKLSFLEEGGKGRRKGVGVHLALPSLR